MKKLQFLLILLVVGAIFVPAVSAETIVNEELREYVDTSSTGKYTGSSVYTYTGYPRNLRFNAIENYPELSYIVVDITGPGPNDVPLGRSEFTYNFNGKNRPGVIYKSQSTNYLGVITSCKLTIFLNDWDIGTLSGPQTIVLPFYCDKIYSLGAQMSLTTPVYLHWDFDGSTDVGIIGDTTYTVASSIPWKNDIKVSNTSNEISGYDILLTRTIDDKPYTSTLEISKDSDIIHFSNKHGTSEELWFPKADINKITITSPSEQVYSYSLDVDDPGDPGEPGDVMLRTGTVTMTDHNGTSIYGFEVTAVNHYTGESYNVSTDTDVAVMTLPMDRTTEIRNPQTGVYETAPIGYYRFYGQAPGYRMLNEDGIRVSIMPEKYYSSYKLCDILVTSETGYLTGKHLFQLRSRSDNSILQTGTISAKSATTGEWYNTTVNGGIATLILPYDTSNAMSQYAGNYYVYATSPGYEDSDYGTQIIVMPHTVSEIKSILLTPIGGVPIPGNVTLRIQVISETGPGVVNAEIFIAGVLGAGRDVWDTYTASSTGYLSVSVPGNSTYDIVASGDGYYDSARRIEVFTDDPDMIEIILYLSGAPIVEPPTEPPDWPTDPPPTQPPGGIPDDDDDSDGFLMQAVRGIGLAFGVGFSTAKIIFGMLLALAIGFTTAKQLRGGAAEFGIGLLGGTLLGILIGLLPVWIIVVLLLVVGLYIGNRYVGGGNNG